MRSIRLASVAFALFLQCQCAAIDSTSPTDDPFEYATPHAATLALEPRDERVDCYNIGTTMERDRLIWAIEFYCSSRMGMVFDAGHYDEQRYYYDDGKQLIVSAQNINGCGSWTVNDNCYHIVYAIMDNCNTNTVTEKQGGELYDPCGHWRVDPGSNESDW